MHARTEDRGDSLQLLAIHVVEGRRRVGIKIEHRNQPSIRIENWHDDLRSRRGIASDMTGKRVHVGDDLSLPLSGGRSAHAAIEGDLQAPERALIRTNAQQLGRHYAIETSPTRIRKFCVEDARAGGHCGNRIAQALDDRAQLSGDFAIKLSFLLLVHGIDSTENG